ncbi:MAG: nucleic acid-binding protein [Gemmataceae bacterium]|nr:nucleic acid-binding protein [Gemmataceae bacterium]
MTRKAVFLDSTPLGLLCGPPRRADVAACRRWADALVAAGHVLLIPECIDYELRRELIRSGKTASVGRLTGLQRVHVYLPLDTDVMLEAADLWAAARRRGRPGAGPNDIDIDVILVAQAVVLNLPNTVVATANVAHLTGFGPAAELWSNIRP